MPRRLTRPEVARRLAIRAARDARPSASFDDLARLFAASKRTVKDATRHDVAGWLAIMERAPVPSTPSVSRIPGQATRVPVPSMPRASRLKAKLVPPGIEPEIDEPRADVDLPEPAFVDEDRPDVDIPEPADPRDPLDDPVPRARVKLDSSTRHA